jgi:hypothetical protein
MTVERPGDKLVVWAEKVEGRRIGVAYPTMEEAHMQRLPWRAPVTGSSKLCGNQIMGRAQVV